MDSVLRKVLVRWGILVYMEDTSSVTNKQPLGNSGKLSSF